MLSDRAGFRIQGSEVRKKLRDDASAGTTSATKSLFPMDKMSARKRKEKCTKFKNLTTDAGMPMKTKDRCGKRNDKAGMLQKTKILIGLEREC